MEIVESKVPKISQNLKNLQNDSKLKIIKDIALGVFVFIVQYPLLMFFERFLISKFDSRFVTNNCSVKLLKFYPFFILYERARAIKNKANSVLAKVFLVGYISYIKPIFDETIYRNYVFSWQKNRSQDPNTLESKVLRVFLNSLIYGTCSIYFAFKSLNWMIIATNFTFSLVLGVLREYTQDTTSSKIVHILDNSINILKYITI